MKSIVLKVNSVMANFGLDPIKMIQSLRGLRFFIANYFKLRKQLKDSKYPFEVSSFYPVLDDVLKKNGATSGHYFHQDLYVARQIYINQPRIHFDVGSRVDGFVSHVASFREIKIVDVRPTDVEVENMEFHQADLSSSLPPDLIGVCDSLSCLHALEHFGLGRYGDAVDINGYQKGFENLMDMLSVDGVLYLSLPIGPQRIEYNAHRVFDVQTIRGLADETKGIIRNFCYVDDIGNFHKNISLESDASQLNFGCIYGCGIFEIVKQS